MTKSQRLAEEYGYGDIHELLGVFATDSIVPGICLNEDCNYTAEYEPDCTEGWCENCNKGTVASALVIEGLI